MSYRYFYFVPGKNYRIGKRKEKFPGKDKWETVDVIPLIPLVGVNYCQPLLHMSKRRVHCILQMKVLINLQLVTCLTPHLTVTKYSDNKF